ncbi:MAG: hypothetical protein ABIF88_03670 [archaeon]
MLEDYLDFWKDENDSEYPSVKEIRVKYLKVASVVAEPPLGNTPVDLEKVGVLRPDISFNVGSEKRKRKGYFSVGYRLDENSVVFEVFGPYRSKKQRKKDKIVRKMVGKLLEQLMMTHYHVLRDGVSYVDMNPPPNENRNRKNDGPF